MAADGQRFEILSIKLLDASARDPKQSADHDYAAA